MPNRMDKTKIGKIALIVAFICVVLIVVITSIVLNNKRKQLDDLRKKNEIVKPVEGEGEENQIFLKNLKFFIDNGDDF